MISESELFKQNMFTIINDRITRTFLEKLNSFSENMNVVLAGEDIPKSYDPSKVDIPFGNNFNWLNKFSDAFDLSVENHGRLVILKKNYKSPFEIPSISWDEYIFVCNQVFYAITKNPPARIDPSSVITGMSRIERQAASTSGIPVRNLNGRSRSAALSLFSHALTSFSHNDFKKIADFSGEKPSIKLLGGSLTLWKNQATTVQVGKYLSDKNVFGFAESSISYESRKYGLACSSLVAEKPVLIIGDSTRSSFVSALSHLYGLRLNRINGRDQIGMKPVRQPGDIFEYITFLDKIIPTVFKRYFTSKKDFQFSQDFFNISMPFFNSYQSRLLRENKNLALSLDAAPLFDRSLNGFLLCHDKLRRMDGLSKKTREVNGENLIVRYTPSKDFTVVRLVIRRGDLESGLYQIAVKNRQ